MQSNTISIVVRFHDSTRLYELERALFSLMMQTYKTVEVVVVTQRFDAKQIQSVTALTARLQRIDPTFDVVIYNFAQAHPRDARSALLNLGIRQAQGRYLAFLDYDDVMQAYAYEKLIKIIKSTSVAIAFGGIAVKFVTLEQDYCLLRFRGDTYVKSLGLADLLHDNHCPIHSFVVDREAVRPELLSFEDSVQRAEDYQFLLRICAEHKSDFSLKQEVIGDYHFKDDGSNTVVTTEAHPEDSTEAWRHAADAIAIQRSKIMLSPAIQRVLGLSRRTEALSVQQYLVASGKAQEHTLRYAKPDVARDIEISQTTTGLPPQSAGAPH